MRVLLLVLGVCLTPCAVVAADPKDPEPLPADVVKAWTAAGAEVGWVGVDRFGGLRFSERREHLGDVQAVPGFLMWSWKKGALAKLPVPEKPFGLMCYQSIPIGIIEESSV